MRLKLQLLVILAFSVFLIACSDIKDELDIFQDDKPFNVDSKTLDVTLDNTEEVTLGVVQSTFFTHLYLPIYEFLDNQDFPEEAVEGEDFNCENGGTANYSSSRDVGEKMYVGDRLSVTYNECVQENGWVYDGSLTAKITKLEGLNERFDVADTETCIANLQSDLGSDVGNDGVVSMSGNEIRFNEFIDYVEVELIDVDGESGETESLIIDRDETLIVVNRPPEPPEGAITSVYGDQVFSVVDKEVEEVECQRFEKTLSATLSQFSVKKDDITYMIDGNLNLFEGTKDFRSFVHEIRDSDYTTTIKQEGSVETFNMEGYSIAKFQGPQLDTYVFDLRLGGSISSSVFPGLLTVSLNEKVIGYSESKYPFAGDFEIFGQGFEKIKVVLSDSTLGLQVDYNGDSTGNQRSDIDFSFNVSWDDLFNRDFIKPELDE